MKGWSVALAVLLQVVAAAHSRATPLYGGYNGQSTSWVEYKIGDVQTSLAAASIIFGADSNERSWVRMRISLVPFFTRFEYTRDYLGIQSLAFTTLFPWPLQLGSELAETPDDIPLWWITAYLVFGTGGIDSEGNSWSETGIPGVYGLGADSAGNQWLWIKVSNVLQGFGEDYVPMAQKGAAGETSVLRTERALRSLQVRFDASAAKRLALWFNSSALRRAAIDYTTGKAFAGGVLNRTCDSLFSPALADLWAGEIDNGLEELLADFVKAVQPLLKQDLPLQ